MSEREEEEWGELQSDAEWGSGESELERVIGQLSRAGHHVFTLLNLDGSIRYESAYVSKLTGYTKEELIGASALAFVHVEDQPRIVRLLDALYRDGVNTHRGPVTYRWRHKEGRWLHLSSVGVVLRKGAELDGILLWTHDLTPHHERVAELMARVAELEAELEATRRAARAEPPLTAAPEGVRSEGTLRERSEGGEAHLNMIRLYDHELRTPLHTILGYVELLLEERGSEAQGSKELERVSQAAGELHELIDDLVELARHEDEDLDMQLEQLTVGALLEALRGELAGEGLSLEESGLRTSTLYTDRRKLVTTLKQQARHLAHHGAALRLQVQQREAQQAVELSWEVEGFDEEELRRMEGVLAPGFRLTSEPWARRYLGVYLGRERLALLGGWSGIERGERGVRWVNTLSTWSDFSWRHESEASSPGAPGVDHADAPDLIWVGQTAEQESYLANWSAAHGLAFTSTRQSKELFAMLAEHEPRLILVDVLGGGSSDGWKLLWELERWRERGGRQTQLVVYAALEDDGLSQELGADHSINSAWPREQIATALEEALASSARAPDEA